MDDKVSISARRRSNALGPLSPGAATSLDAVAQTHHLSRAAYERLKAEYDDLTTRGRIEIARKIETARELGDLSENGDYHAAKEEQGHMEGRIAHLAAMLENAEIVEGPEGTETVGPGSIVSIVYEDDDAPERYLVGSIEERHDDLEVVSLTSPLGSALLGKSVGDEVSYETPTGLKLTVTIVEIEG
jgi:transcription elongation factor GreA